MNARLEEILSQQVSHGIHCADRQLRLYRDVYALAQCAEDEGLAWKPSP